MTAPVFVDTNVLVYARDATEPLKQARALVWLETLWRSARGRISYQVLQEFYVTVTRKLRPGMDREAARADVRNLLAWNPLPVGATVFEGAWRVQDRFGMAWWDALIVSAAQTADCGILLTEDLTDGQVFGGVKVVNPFLHGPETA
ncbi:MAG: PIN domain-containing protein [Planctomycetes bacterium]|nr:PIN domain-containing protein [Planctomycetota bacterium]